MPRHAKRYSVIVALVLLAPFALTPFLMGTLANRPPPQSFAVRCGELMAALLIACGFAYMATRLISAGWLFYAAHRRGAGHVLNPITRVYAADDLITGLVYLASALGLGRLSCYAPVVLFSAATIAAGVKAIWVTHDTPMLARIPDGYKEAAQVAELRAQLAQLQPPPDATPAEVQRVLTVREQCATMIDAAESFLIQAQARTVAKGA